jgi:60 kDa SS-A/Ro ribonucleoprotein
VNGRAKLVCIDIQPGTTTQAIDRSDILNVGGFSDAVFEAVASFAKGQLGASHWVGEIASIAL